MRKWPSYSSGLCMYVVPCIEHVEHLALPSATRFYLRWHLGGHLSATKP